MSFLRIPVTFRSSALIIGAVVVGAYVIFGGPSGIRRKKKRKDNIPGLANIGNSCFLNALVQSLASCPLFISWLSSKKREPSPPLVSTLHSLLQVLNNEGDHNGDACAGKVMGALRGHGWVISSEEQDAHELFHAVTATIDEELSSMVLLPSLLDLSWIGSADASISSQLGDCNGIVFKSDCWRQDRSPYREKSVQRGSFKKLRNSAGGSIKNSVNGDCKVELNGNIDVVLVDENDDEKIRVITSPKYNHECDVPLKNIGGFNSNCDDKGCDNGVVTNGHTNGLSSPAQECDMIIKVEDFDTQKVIINTSAASEIQANITGENGKVIHENEDNINGNTELLSDDAKMHSSRHERSGLTNSKSADLKSEGSMPLTKAHNSKHHDSPFQGFLASQLQCTLCGYKNPAQWTSFESLSLSLPSIPWGEVTLQELLDSYVTQEKVTDVTCEGCTKNAGTSIKSSFTKQLTIGKLPSCLCFHIKRTVWMDNGAAVKRQDHVLFPEFLTMDPYTYVTSVNCQEFKTGILGGRPANFMANASLNNTDVAFPSSVINCNAISSEVEASPFFRVTSVRCEHLYRLKACIVHLGDIFCGHFVTYRRGPLGTRSRNRWFYTSDLTVRESSLEEVRKSNAYMILYEKVLTE